MNKLVEVKHDTSCMKDRKHNSLQRHWRGKWGRGAHVASTVKCKAYWGFVVIILTEYLQGTAFLFCPYTLRSNLLGKHIHRILINNENRLSFIFHASTYFLNKIDSTALNEKH